MKKIVKTLLALLLAVTTTINVYVPKAADEYSLSGKTLLNDLFDFTPFNMSSAGAIVAYMQASGPFGTTSAYCIEPHITAHLGDIYEGIDGSDNDEARQVILNNYQNYRNHELWDTTAGYYAAQLAVWGRIENVSPSSLNILSGLSSEQTALAGRIKDLAVTLYNDHSSVESGYDLLYNNASANSNYDLTGSEYIYFYHGEGYYRSEPMTVVTDGLAGDLSFTVNVSNGLVTNSRNGGAGNSLSFGEGTDNGTIFYIYVPISTSEQTVVNITGNYEYLDVMSWRFKSGPYGTGQNLMSLNQKTGRINETVTFNGAVLTIDNPNTSYTATVNYTKTGEGPKGVTTSSTPYGTRYDITAGTIGLTGGVFGFYKQTSDTTIEIINKIGYVTDESGRVTISNLPLEIQSDGKGYLFVCEIKAPKGYGTYTSTNAITSVEGLSCIKKSFDPATADASNVITRDITDNDSSRRFTISINKIDQDGNPMRDIEFGIYNTESIVVKPVLGDASQNIVIPSGSLVGIAKTDTAGNATFETQADGTNYLPIDQKYIVKELSNIKAITEYTYDGNTYSDGVEIDPTNQTTDTATYTIRVKNYLTSLVTVHKTDDTGAGMKGVDFTLSNASYSYSGTTDDAGILRFDNVHYGTYTLTEVSTPAGYEPISPMNVVVRDETLDINITNTKYPTSTITINKAVEGNNPTDKRFEFSVVGSGINEVISIDGAGSNSKDLTFTAPGTYTYSIKEVDKGYNGYTFDTTVYTKTYTVVRNSGKLVIESETLTKTENGVTSNATSIDFKNSYSPSPVTYVLPITKTLIVDQGVNSSNNPFLIDITGDGYNDTLSIMKGETKNKTFSFSEAGTYNYTIKERNSGTEGYTYDDSVYNIEIVVIDNNGTLEINRAFNKDTGANLSGITFVNRYSQHYDPVSMSIKIRKNISGINADDVTDIFDFTIKNISTGSTNTISIPGKGSRQFNIPEFTAAGIYKYEITENDIARANWNKDNSVYTIEFVVTDVKDALHGYFDVTAKVYKDGVLQSTYQKDEIPEIAFTNTYAIPDGNYHIADIEIKKTANVKIKDTELFKAYVNSEEYVLKQDTPVTAPLYVPNAGTYDFLVREANTGEANWTYDSTVYKVTVTVEQNGYDLELADLVIKKNDTTPVTEIVFNNIYTRPETIQDFGTVKISKTANIASNEPFKYTVTTNGVAGSPTDIKIGDEKLLILSASKAGTKTFVIKENILTELTENEGLNLTAWTFDDSVYTIELVTELDAYGRDLVLVSKTLKKGDTVISPDASGNYSISFYNHYGIRPVSDTVTIEKEVKGTKLNDEFTFEINDGTGVESVNISGSGTKTKTFTFTSEGTYTYKITEKNMGYAGYDFDETEYTVTYEIVKNNDRYSIASKSVSKNGTVLGPTESIKFVNSKTYAPVTANLSVKKQFNLPNDVANNITSTFNMTSIGNFTIKGNGSKNLSFTFDYDDIGTNLYTLKEVKGTDDRITYDETVHVIAFTVSESASGLQVRANTTSVTFNNKFTYSPIQVTIPVRKMIVGNSTPEDKEFAFTVNGTEKVFIKGAGFKNYYETFTDAADVELSIKEVDSKYDNYTFDTSEYKVRIKVYKEGLELKSSVEVTKNGSPVDYVVFQNKYTKPAEPAPKPEKPDSKPETPNTKPANPDSKPEPDAKQLCLAKGSSYYWNSKTNSCVKKIINTGVK